MSVPGRRSATQPPGDSKGATVGEPEPVRIRLLAGFRITVEARAIQDNEWRLRKAASLVKMLTLAQGHRLHREQVMDRLWPHLDPRASSNNLHHALHYARRTLEPTGRTGGASRLLLRQEHLVLCPEGRLWIDVEAFEEAAAAAQARPRSGGLSGGDGSVRR